jgi:hypothetical protein
MLNVGHLSEDTIPEGAKDKLGVDVSSGLKQFFSLVDLTRRSPEIMNYMFVYKTGDTGVLQGRFPSEKSCFAKVLCRVDELGPKSLQLSLQTANLNVQ